MKLKSLKKWQRVTIITVFSVIAVLLVVFFAFLAVRSHGKQSLFADVLQNHDATEEQSFAETTELTYDGENYVYRENLYTFLMLGIDNWEVVSKAKDGISGGQSDAIFLVVVDTDNKKISVIAVPRNSMVVLDVYDKDGNYKYQGYGQITLQHGYGDGMELSCERTANTVSRLFYQIPINGYCAVNMGAVGSINDAVGGVELTSIDSFNLPDFGLQEGTTIHLHGIEAYYYLKYRDTSVFDTASKRLDRQKQYLSIFIKQALEETKNDVTFPMQLYEAIEPFVVTDLSTDEILYLASEIADYDFDEIEILSVPGETVMGEKFEEFHIDKDAFFQMILPVFCEKK